jgi:pimeloyl-ACP methyl ester carboxylesterase
MGVGYSYGGALAINFAYLYPEDVKLILSSSGVVDWPFLAYDYEDQVRANFGDKLYGRIVKHVNNLEPEEVFDETWQEREFLLALISGLAQLQQFEKYLPLFKALSMLPTPLFLKAMHFIDDNMADGAAWDYAYSRSSLTLSREEAATGRYAWRVYMYQQCREFFDFWMSKEERGLYTRSVEDYCEECETMFGEDLLANAETQWMIRDMVPELSVPMVYVNGGLDPWGHLCLEPDYPLENGVYLYYPDKKHCPDNKDAAIGSQVLSVMLEILEETTDTSE